VTLSEVPENFLSKFFRTAATVFGTALEAVNGLLENAYRKGYEDGAAAMRNSLLRAAQAPLNIPPMPDITEVMNVNRTIVRQPETPDSRAPRGSVARFVMETLRGDPGLTQIDLKLRAVNAGVSPAGIGNELRRHKDRKYRKDARKGWHLIQSQAPASAGEPRMALSAHEVQQAAE
jgi:hypothetical protein